MTKRLIKQWIQMAVYHNNRMSPYFEWGQVAWLTHSHKHIHTHIYIYIYICMCVLSVLWISKCVLSTQWNIFLKLIKWWNLMVIFFQYFPIFLCLTILPITNVIADSILMKTDERKIEIVLSNRIAFSLGWCIHRRNKGINFNNIYN